MRISIRPNKVIKSLIITEFTFWTGWGLVTPVFAIFVVEQIKGGSVFVVGMASAVFWIARSVFRIPFGIFVDACPTEKDDYFVMVSGFLLASLVPLGYIFTSTPAQIYFLQGVHGLGLAMAYSGLMPIFTKHLDKGKESTEWGLNGTLVGIGLGIAGAVGGWAVTRFGFNSVFVVVSVFGLIGTVILFALRNEIKGVFDNGFNTSLKSIFNGKKINPPDL